MIMAVPFLFFPGLKSWELVAFEAIQTSLNVALFVAFSVLVMRVFSRFDKQAAIKEPARHVIKKAAVTVLLIEASNLAVAMSWYMLVLLVLVGLVVLFSLYLGIPFFIVYLRYFRKGIFSEWRVIAFYIIVALPALACSAAMTSGIFWLAGVPTYFIFTF